MRSFCIVNNKAVSSNQANILAYFIKKIDPQISFDFKKQGDLVLVNAYIARLNPKWRTIS